MIKWKESNFEIVDDKIDNQLFYVVAREMCV